MILALSKITFLLCIVFTLPVSLLGQELNCRFTVNDDQVQGMDKRIFREMQKSFQEFLNTTSFTDLEIQNEERIRCDITLTITQAVPGSFQGTAIIQYARPVYNTSYSTLILNYVDPEWEFQFTEGRPINFVRNTFTDNLTSLLSFYAYLLIGIDMDSFSPLGGTRYLDQAFQIMNMSQQGGGPGWDNAGNTNNRHWLISNFMNQQLEPFRRSMYLYHRKGLDIYQKDREGAQQNVLQALKNIQLVNKVFPVSVAINGFFDVKSQEIVDIFSRADQTVKREAVAICTEVDPTRSNVYMEMMKSN